MINRILELQKSGLSDNEILRQLQSEGVSPKELRDSLNQARVKSAVYQEEHFGENEEMNPSIMQGQEAPGQDTPIYAPENPAPQSQQPEQNYYAETPQSYQGNQGYYSPQAPSDMEVITEIAEQVTSEKINELKKKIGDIPSFRSEIKDSISNLDERLRRIENTLDKIQQSIIGKIGEFGENSSLIQKDLNNIHQTMSKLMDPLVDNYKALKKISERE